jgi:hypothetical protein
LNASPKGGAFFLGGFGAGIKVGLRWR